MFRVAVALKSICTCNLQRSHYALPSLRHSIITCSRPAYLDSIRLVHNRQSSSSSSSTKQESRHEREYSIFSILGNPRRLFVLLLEKKPSRKTIISVLCWISVFIYFTKHFYSTCRITGASMSPTLNPNSSEPPDIVLINKYAAKPEVSSLQIGDVVTLISPIDPNRIITKRILALGGDIVSVGNRLSTRHSSSRGASLEEDEGKDEEETEHKDKIRIPPFHMWLEGDATALEYRSDGKLEIPSNLKSRDSREFGPVSIGLIIGRVECVLWPFSRFGTLPPRPNFDLEKALFRRRVKAQNESYWTNLKFKRAHPDDSTISPYSDDSEWSSDSSRKGDVKRVGKGEEKSLQKDKSRKSQRGDESVETARREVWNRMSRGGQMGNDAGRMDDGVDTRSALVRRAFISNHTCLALKIVIDSDDDDYVLVVASNANACCCLVRYRASSVVLERSRNIVALLLDSK